MYRKRDRKQVSIDEFITPFGGKLSAENRWVKLSKVIPWDWIEDRYATKFGKCGNVAIPLRVALGALIIKEKCGFTDEETVENISENNYMQYFIGYKEFTARKPFVPSLMVEFRKRIDMAEIQRIIDETDEGRGGRPGGSGGENEGTLMLDATCAPADIRYPTDLGLLNESREALEGIIDTMWKKMPHKPLVKPRTYRVKARKAYLRMEKQRNKRYKTIRTAVGQQLRYVRRDLQSIQGLLKETGSLEALSSRQYKNLLVVSEIYRQQREMYEGRHHRVEDRIVSLSQPHVRPIVRGKASSGVEFGAKIAVSKVNGCCRIETLSWDNFNEGTRLTEAVQRYKERFGCYPKVILADKLYRNRENLHYCKTHGIRLSGPQLGRPKRDQTEDRRIARADNAARNGIESPFGIGKRRYGLARIMAKLRCTSETVITMQFLIMNLDYKLRACFYRFFKRLVLDVIPLPSSVENWRC